MISQNIHKNSFASLALRINIRKNLMQVVGMNN